MGWRKPTGWVAVCWGAATIALGLTGVLDDLVVSVLAGVGLVVPGASLILQDRVHAKEDDAATDDADGSATSGTGRSR